jgi:ABC-type transporter Mla subunit MlaD
VTANQMKEQIADIEATQAALRDSIEATKGLAAEAETLLQKHRQTLEQEQSSLR